MPDNSAVRHKWRNCLDHMRGRRVNTAWNAISLPDRQRSLRRNTCTVFCKHCRNDGVLGDTLPELGARNLAHPLQL